MVIRTSDEASLVRDRAAAPLRAWVPVAPVSTSEGRAVFPDLSLPTMIVYGERDTGLGHRYVTVFLFSQNIFESKSRHVEYFEQKADT